jgi:hypothetical protein
MSEISQESLSYRAVIAEYFLGLRGSGLLLSPLDEDLVADWERRGLPVAVVCRGLRRGLEQQLEERGDRVRLPRSLRAYRFAVEEEWRAYRQGRVGQASPPGDEDLAARERLEAARQHLEDAARTDPPRRETYIAAARALAASTRSTLHTLALAERAIAGADDVLLRSWVAALTRPERSAIGPRLRLLAGPRPRRTRPRAYRQTLRSHLLDAARRAGLRCLRGSV